MSTQTTGIAVLHTRFWLFGKSSDFKVISKAGIIIGNIYSVLSFSAKQIQAEISSRLFPPTHCGFLLPRLSQNQPFATAWALLAVPAHTPYLSSCHYSLLPPCLCTGCSLGLKHSCGVFHLPLFLPSSLYTGLLLWSPNISRMLSTESLATPAHHSCPYWLDRTSEESCQPQVSVAQPEQIKLGRRWDTYC